MKKCPSCAEEIQDEATICKHCGRVPATPEILSLARRWWKIRDKEQARLWAAMSVTDRTLLTETLKTTPPAPGGMTASKGCLLFLLMCGVSLAGLVFVANISGPTTSENSRSSSGASVGDEVRLVVGSGQVVVCVDEDAYRELTKLAVADDMLGIGELVASGRAFAVESGTKASVIETGFERRRVRVLEGRHFGKAGWVTKSLVE
jgi:hypothetical protein